MAAPKSESRFQLANMTNVHAVSWTIINDFGAISKSWSQNF
ncbi:hypothetical protein ACSTIH_23635 [Vibrio parahaemolyticus]